MAGGTSVPEDPKNSPLSVTEAVNIVSGHVKDLPELVVTGEVSGFRGPNVRGHCYFDLKDSESGMAMIIWNGIYRSSGIQLRDGMQIEVVGRFEVYKSTGKLSFIAKSFQVAGEGMLRQQVAELARRLQAEGLMDESRKRKIPAFCTRVCVVTSLTGSVIDDVKRTLARRNPLVELDVVGCQVQGKQAPPTIVRGLAAAAASNPDAILLVRGGGSFEDLMCFNDESVARAVAASPVPVITGIGHEPDTSICDMVADRRCSTPTAAAESVAPALGEIESIINQRGLRLGKAMSSILATDVDRIEALGDRAARSMEGELSRLETYISGLASRRCLTDPMAMVTDRIADLRQSEQRLHDAIPRSLERSRTSVEHNAQLLSSIAGRMLTPYKAALAKSAATLDALSPLKVLSRGYAITKDAEGHVISSADQVAVNDQISVLLGSGQLDAKVCAVRSEG